MTRDEFITKHPEFQGLTGSEIRAKAAAMRAARRSGPTSGAG